MGVPKTVFEQVGDRPKPPWFIPIDDAVPVGSELMTFEKAHEEWAKRSRQSTERKGGVTPWGEA